jgi:hypothetical protein
MKSFFLLSEAKQLTKLSSRPLREIETPLAKSAEP